MWRRIDYCDGACFDVRGIFHVGLTGDEGLRGLAGRFFGLTSTLLVILVESALVLLGFGYAALAGGQDKVSLMMQEDVSE